MFASARTKKRERAIFTVSGSGSQRSCRKSKRQLDRERPEGRGRSKEQQQRIANFLLIDCRTDWQAWQGQLCYPPLLTSCHFPSAHTHPHTHTSSRAPPNVLKTLQFCSVVKFNFLVEFMRKLQKSYSNCLASHQRYGQCKKGVPQSKRVSLQGGGSV